MIHPSTDLSPDGSQVVRTYAPPASHGANSRQLEIDVLYTSAPLSQAEQADAKEGLTVASAPQYGAGGYMADGNLPQYGLMCRVAGKANTGAIVSITVTAPTTPPSPTTRPTRQHSNPPPPSWLSTRSGAAPAWPTHLLDHQFTTVVSPDHSCLRATVSPKRAFLGGRPGWG